MEQLNTHRSTFTSCMHDQMLESNRDDVKLEAMRCVTVMTAKGKLTVPRTLFPHIVKNVSSKNPELKKLIYLYLGNFADQEPDLALLPVATLQKSLKSPNPLIRSSALKVLTSMRLNILSAILMATLRNSINDLSPYVRKTVAHSIIKIYRLDPSLKADLVEYIERLFNDKNSMVLSSAIATFEVVCPEKLDLVHKHYRRFCFILADCNEWGQTVLLSLMRRYIVQTYGQKNVEVKDYNPSEHDPKILLRSAKPLVHSFNSAVVMAVIKLYIAIAHLNEMRSTITRPLIRLLYSHREIELLVLNMIEELTMFKSDDEVHEEEDFSDDEELIVQKTEVKEEVLMVEHTEKNNNEEKFEHQADEDVNRVGSQKDTYEEVIDDEKENNVEDGISKENDDESVKPDEDEDGDSDEESDEESEEETDDESEEDSEEDDDSDEDDGEESEIDEIVDDHQEGNKCINGKPNFDPNLIDLNTNKDTSAFREVFRPYIKSFYVKPTDSTQIRLAKLRILTNLSSPVNVTLVLKELQAYISAYVEDREFISASIQAIGRCAILVKKVAHTCLNSLTSLLSNNNEHIVSEAIVVLRSQIINKKPSELLHRKNNISNNNTNNHNEISDKEQSDEKSNENDDKTQTQENQEEKEDRKENDRIVSTVIKQVTKLLPTVTAPQARATILWILAEFCDKNLTAAKCAPNVLRSIAKSFCQEDNFVKLQSLTLASKFLLSLDKEKKAELYHKVNLLTGYLFSLAKYDIDHDVRDRGRFLKKLLEDQEICTRVLYCTHDLN